MRRFLALLAAAAFTVACSGDETTETVGTAAGTVAVETSVPSTPVTETDELDTTDAPASVPESTAPAITETQAPATTTTQVPSTTETPATTRAPATTRRATTTTFRGQVAEANQPTLPPEAANDDDHPPAGEDGECTEQSPCSNPLAGGTDQVSYKVDDSKCGPKPEDQPDAECWSIGVGVGGIYGWAGP